MAKIIILFLIHFIFFLNCAKNPLISGKSSSRRVMLEIVGETQARQLYIDGFEKLSLKEKIFAYYIVRAGIAGRDIFYDQNHRNALEIRELCEEILLHAKKLDDDVYDAIREYTHKFWINCCSYENFSKMKFIPDVPLEAFTDGIQMAIKNGSNFRTSNGQTVSEYISSMEDVFYNLEFEPMITVKKIVENEDYITASANNFYENLTLSEINEWIKQGNEKYPYNSKLVKIDDSIVEQVYRSGEPDSAIAEGQYAGQLKNVIKYLELSKPYADSSQVLMIDKMIRFYKTGNYNYAVESGILWLQHDPKVDFLQGFIEVYTDPRGKKGSFQNLVYFRDEKYTEILKKLVEYAPELEKNAPYLDKYKKTKFNLNTSAIAALVISGMGDSGPMVPAGLNLPNNEELREKFGSKNLIFTNILGISGGNDYTWERDYARRFVYEFFHPEDIEELLKVKENAGFAMVALHELIGHGAGRMNPELKNDPTDYLKEYYSTIEEARAELTALWHIHNPKLFSIGLVPDERAADEIYRQWARYYLLKLCYLEDEESIEQDHERARHLIMNYVREKGAFDIVKIRGKLYAVIKSKDDFRDAIGKLLAEIMRIKAEGDYNSAKKLVQTYGIHFNKNWRNQMVARYKKLQKERAIVTNRGYCMPVLVPVKDRHGNFKDIRIKYLTDFEKEQLYYSGKVELY